MVQAWPHHNKMIEKIEMVDGEHQKNSSELPIYFMASFVVEEDKTIGFWGSSIMLYVTWSRNALKRRG